MGLRTKITNTYKKSGLALVEAVVAVSILLIIFVGVISAYNYYLYLSINNIPLVKAAYLAEEGVEAVKIFRDLSWNDNVATLGNGTGYHLIFNAGSYEATTTVLMIDGQYSRMLYLEEVRRNADKDIRDSGDVDDNIRKVTIAVSWQDDRGTTTKKISTYVTNLFKN